MTTSAGLTVPYITVRHGETPDLERHLCVRPGPDGRQRLAWINEGLGDRDLRGVLWGRVSQELGIDRHPEGTPRWRLVHPARQRETMLYLQCQVCVTRVRDVRRQSAPAARPGVLFLAAQGADLTGPVRIAQPPVCVEHARLSAQSCTHLVRRGHVALLARRYRLYGVIGVFYELTVQGLRPLPADDAPVPYGDPRLDWFLASQLVRELDDFEMVDLADLTTAT
ncbi:hypothetical protein ACIBL6_15975 [Streptomyces sp. NPDC050400]|uniref:hypothetical protein n=1 Tax=Streptomyces sp. NPDC050400 TaxID=3365610 RepID=UPI00378870D2